MKTSAFCLTVLTALGLSANAALAAKEERNAAAYASKSKVKQRPSQNLRRERVVKPHDVVDQEFVNKAGNLQTRIIGGSRVKIPHPYFALLEVGCGATLIHDDMLLSAAHCDINNIFLRKVWIGGVELETGLERDVVRTISHPQYDAWTIEYDFMLMKLNTTALLDPYYRPSTTVSGGIDSISVTITSPTKLAKQANQTGLYVTGVEPIAINRDPNVPAEGDPLTIMGFGITDPNQFGLVDDLYENTVYAVDDADCNAAYGSQGYTPEVMMCAGHPRGGADTCQGDSGGPMIDQTHNVIVGVTSWGEGCGLQSYPGVYSQVDAVQDWIDEEICKNSCYPPDTCDPDILHPCASAVEVGGGVVELSGPVEFTITVTLDTYPSEFGAILSHYESDTELWYVPYNSWEDFESPYGNLLVVEETFSDLPAGIYHLMLGDKAFDGLCCSYGEGNVIITNAAGDELWSDNGDYGSFQEVYLNISETGDLVWAANNPDGTIDDGWDDDDEWPTSSPGPGPSPGDDILEGYDPSEDDEDWPGAYPIPVNTTNAITINIRTDRFPEETSWTWSRRTGPETFEIVDSGAPLRSEVVLSYNKFVENESIYKFTVSDSLYDGTCCFYGFGWFTITNATATEDNPDGTVVWRMTGDEFDNYEDVYLWIDAEGHSHLAEYIPGQGYALIIYDLVSEERSIVVPETKAAKAGPKRFGGLFP